MKVSFIVWYFCATSLLSLTPSSSAQGDGRIYYSSRYDNIDVNTIFRSSRLMNNYVDCLLDKKPCPAEGKELKRKFVAKFMQKSSEMTVHNCPHFIECCKCCRVCI